MQWRAREAKDREDTSTPPPRVREAMEVAMARRKCRGLGECMPRVSRRKETNRNKIITRIVESREVVVREHRVEITTPAFLGRVVGEVGVERTIEGRREERG